MTLNLETFVRAYVVAALWSSTDENGEPLDAVFSPDDIAPECAAAMRASCAQCDEGGRSFARAKNRADAARILGIEQFTLKVKV